MNSPLEAPEKQIAEETSAKPQATASVIDTSKMSAGKAAALDLAESSRDPLDERGSFPRRHLGSVDHGGRDLRLRAGLFSDLLLRCFER